MFDDEVYEVTRDEFKGFMDQIKSDCFDYETYRIFSENTNNVESQEIKIVSKDDKRLFAKVTSTTDEVHYYIYEMPTAEERCAPKAVRKIILESPEEVKAFFEALNKIQKGNKK